MNPKSFIRTCTAILLLTCCNLSFGQPVQRAIFANSLADQKCAALFNHNDQWRINKKQAILSKISALSPQEKAGLLAEADQALNYDWPAFKTSQFLEFKTTGNLANFGESFNKRRRTLISLMIGGLIDRTGKYLPQIANGLWLILEESSWVVPEHLVLQKAGAGLPDPEEQIIDLTAGETAALVSWTRLFFSDQLQQLSPMFNKRIDYELNRRIITPYLQRNDFGWMGFGNRTVNNWNIWINTNILKTALLAVDDESNRNAMIEKAMRSSDKFLNSYPEDGGCEEGASYWGHAGAKLIEFVDLLGSASNGALNWSNNELIHNIGAYIYKMQIDSNRFVNFADASATTIPSPARVFKYGQVFNDPLLKGFAGYLFQLSKENKIPVENINDFVNYVEVYEQLRKEQPQAPMLKENWMPGVQVLTLRQHEGTVKGLFFAAQGGHNAESHNHNDVGNFVLYLDGKPAIIDVGVGTYTRQTFSSERYQLWYMQSQWHNCPTINGVQQKDGKAFRAKDISYSKLKDGATLTMDIADAYPADAAVKSWVRSFVFNNKQGSLILNENYTLQSWKEPFALHFMTPLHVQQNKPGEIILQDKDSKMIRVLFNADLFTVLVDDKLTEDPRLTSIWGEKLFRISLRAKRQTLQAEHNIEFKTIN
ncbi:MAG: heparinase II/III family protein [Bacteroidota bacterium]